MLSQSNEEVKLLEKIKRKEANIMILGLGQVGLPTAVALLECGYSVNGFDIDKSRVDQINSGVSPIPEKNFNKILAKYLNGKKFSATNNPDSLLEADVIIVCVATPLNLSRTNADLGMLGQAIMTVAYKLDRMKLIIIESTIPPGTMKNYVIPKVEATANKKNGEHFLISYCPERISPGNAIYEFLNNSRLIGAEDIISSTATLELLSRVTSGRVYQTDTATAELCKLAENSYRDVNIAFANELAMICENHKVDSAEVIKLANTHPRVNIHSPGPGVGGPCLPKDPYLLLVNFMTQNSLIRTARSINDKMPEHVVDLILSAVTGNDYPISKLNVLILGSSYKPNVNDTRNSPTELIIQKLMEAGFTDIKVHDPYTNDTFGAQSTSDLYGTLSRSGCVILATAHSDYLNLRPEMFRKEAIVLDTVRLLKRKEFDSTGLRYISIG